jgi:hypothetical protein
VDARTLLWIAMAALGLAGCESCRSKTEDTPPPLASTDPAGKDLVVGTVVAATEQRGGVRLYKIIEVNWFPPPIGDELVMIAYAEKAADFEQARTLWHGRQLTVAFPKVRVARQMFLKRDRRIITTEPVVDAEKDAGLGAPQSKPSG